MNWSSATPIGRSKHLPLIMVALLGPLLFAPSARAQDAAPAPVRVVAGEGGLTLDVQGKPLMVRGMNWDYIPIGQNYQFDLWSQPDDFIRNALANEMPLLKDMGVNAIRVYAGMPPRWVRYIYETYGIYTIINHPMARYGYTLDGVWIPSVDYSNPRLRAAVKAEILALVDQFRGVPGVLMWLLGNENNYGLSWSSFEIEALPKGERDAARARYLYSLFGEVIDAVKARDPGHPVAIANGDVQYIDLIAEECKGLDIFGTNVYRGISARDLFDVVKAKLGVPVMFAEFGADAWNAREMREDQRAQARYLIGQWEEIYEQSSGKGRAGNAIGGCIFQWSDGWWKYKQNENLDVHDTNASWPNGGYTEDFVQGRNNMNEEWWGICAKGRPNDSGLYELYPRAAFYALRQAFKLDPYDPGATLETIRRHFGAIQPLATELEARGDKAALAVDALSRVRLSGLRINLETYTTGGERISTPDNAAPQAAYPSFLGFDRLESYYADFEATPAPNVVGHLSINMLGNVPVNPINEIFYENRGRPVVVQTPQGNVEMRDVERLKVYQSSVTWDDPKFDLKGFYRAGHTHWGYEGDFFGLYREAFYGSNIDTYNGEAPNGIEIAGKQALSGLKFAFGPQLWWGANPAYIFKIQRRIGRFDATGVYQKDLEQQSSVTSSNAIPVPPTETATLYVSTQWRGVQWEIGGIWSGRNKVDQPFQILGKAADGSDQILEDFVRTGDTFGVKGKVSGSYGRVLWYGQGAMMGLVADGGPTATVTYTGWNLKDSGSGNQSNVLAGVAVNAGRIQVAPNILYQKPLVGPIPANAPVPGRPRDILSDPFAVLANREMTAAELLLTWDPTPATWMWAWDNDVREDARLAGSLGFVYRHLPTTRDASLGILADGSTVFAFPGAPPAADLWELRARLVSRASADLRLVATLFGGTAQANTFDNRRVEHYGVDTRLGWRDLEVVTAAHFNDWGPYDYHRDFNLTFPVQLMADVSHTLGMPRWFDLPQTRFGVRGTWRSLDQYSPRYSPGTVPGPNGTLVPDPTIPAPNGNEWEIRTYLHFAM
jgi:beta-galactosidase